LIELLSMASSLGHVLAANIHSWPLVASRTARPPTSLLQSHVAVRLPRKNHPAQQPSSLKSIGTLSPATKASLLCPTAAYFSTRATHLLNNTLASSLLSEKLISVPCVHLMLCPYVHAPTIFINTCVRPAHATSRLQQFTR